MVPRDAGAAGPVLQAYCKWDPHGLARRLPSRGVAAWRCAPILPGQLQCPVGVCATLVAGQEGGMGATSRRYPPPLLSLPSVPPRACSGCPVRLSLAVACGYAIPTGLCLPRACSSCPSRGRRMSVVWLCARAPAAFASLPPCLFALALCEIPSQGAGRAVPRVSCSFACPAWVPCSASCGLRGLGGGGPRVSLPVSWWCWGVSGVSHSPFPRCLSLGQAVRVRCPCSSTAGGVGMGARH